MKRHPRLIVLPLSIFLLFVFTAAIVMKGWFRAIAAAFPAEAAAQAFAGLSILVLAIYTGYTIPRPSIHKGLRWVTWINPLRYTFESIIANEFRTLNGPCSNVVPSGAGYENVNIANTVCATVGAEPGQSTVNGARYLSIAFGYSYSNEWRVRSSDSGAKHTDLVQSELRNPDRVRYCVYRRASHLHGAQHSHVRRDCRHYVQTRLSQAARVGPCCGLREGPKIPGREHNGGQLHSGSRSHSAAGLPAEAEKALETAVVKTTDTFTWRNVRYTIPAPGGGERRLLDDVSGYVVPGKLTALMGESGAGA